MFLLFVVSLVMVFLASRAAVSSFSWHPTQENHMLTISPSGECFVKLSLQVVTRVMRNGQRLVVLPFSYYNILIDKLSDRQATFASNCWWKKGGLVDLHNCSGLVHFTHSSCILNYLLSFFRTHTRLYNFWKNISCEYCSCELK